MILTERNVKFQRNIIFDGPIDFASDHSFFTIDLIRLCGGYDYPQMVWPRAAIALIGVDVSFDCDDF